MPWPFPEWTGAGAGIGVGVGRSAATGAAGRTGAAGAGRPAAAPARLRARLLAVASKASTVAGAAVAGRGAWGATVTAGTAAARGASAEGAMAPRPANCSRTFVTWPAGSRPRWSNCTNVAPSRPSRILRVRPVSTPDGPTSTNVRTPSAHSASTSSTQRTVCVIWRTRLSRTSAAERIGDTVVLLQTRRAGAATGSRSTIPASRSAAAASSGVWNGLGTASRFDRIRRPSRTSSTASTARARPPTTDCSGPFSAHTHTWPANGAIAAATSSRPAITDSIAPSAGPSSSTAAARAAVAFAPSAKLQAPAAASAGNSPNEWLAKTSGAKPACWRTRQARRSPRYIAHCVSQTRVPSP